MNLRFAALIVGTALSGTGIAIGADTAADLMKETQRENLQKTVATCGTCHGVDGRSISPTFPNLAAQSAPYIELQLHAFKDQTLAAYFSKQPAARNKGGDAALIALGSRIFTEGVPSRQVQACASCHGPHAEGLAVFPRLAGQHAPYLLKQLLVIQSVLRSAPVMHGVIKDLTREQMEAVAAYLESI
jgi:cytochrome c553